MRRRIQAVYGVTLTAERVRQIAHQLGFTLVRPKHLSRQSSPEVLAAAQEEIDSLFERAKQGEILLFYQDEARQNDCQPSLECGSVVALNTKFPPMMTIRPFGLMGSSMP